MKEPFASAYALARRTIIAEAHENGGTVADTACPACGEPVVGLVCFDAGEAATESSPAKAPHNYVAAYARGCNCNVDRKVTEDSLLSALDTNEEAA